MLQFTLKTKTNMPKLIIKIGGQSYDHKMLGNLVYLPDGVATDAKDGDEIDVNVKGELIEHDGVRCIHVKEVDGEPVAQPPDNVDTIEDSNPNADTGTLDEGSADNSNDTSYNQDNGNQSLDQALSKTFNRNL